MADIYPQSVPQVPYSSLERGLSEAEMGNIKSSGCVIVRGAVSQEQALGWGLATREYIVKNKEHVKGTLG